MEQLGMKAIEHNGYRLTVVNDKPVWLKLGTDEFGNEFWNRQNFTDPGIMGATFPLKKPFQSWLVDLVNKYGEEVE